MNFSVIHSAIVLTLMALAGIAIPAAAADLATIGAKPPDTVALPKPAEVQSLFRPIPPASRSKAGTTPANCSSPATIVGDRTQDLTGDVTYSVADTKIARVTSSGRVLPLANGSTPRSAPVTARRVARACRSTSNSSTDNLPINFTNQVVPIFTKLGCNSGGCHGKASGQNGFKLSLLGFEPEVDYAALVKEARGRRLFPAAPDQSLLLLKPTGAMGPRRRQTSRSRLR